MSNLRTLTVTRDAAQYIFSCIAEQPYKHVALLLAELQAQLQVQDASQPNAGQPTDTATSGEAPLASESTPATAA